MRSDWWGGRKDHDELVVRASSKNPNNSLEGGNGEFVEGMARSGCDCIAWIVWDS